ncbi:MAG: hypothetical protein KatS3mg105_4490 [Gemmatales bacterium]|nr:MAG: hypothetical protein KatS3mg105_4490 [Gemmatales bacterium]
MADETKPAATSQTGSQSSPFSMDTSSLSTVYTNFCHVTSLPEELILDFGLNTQVTPTQQIPVKLTHRVVMNFYTAKRLLNALHFFVRRYEEAFGPLELDVQKRARAHAQPKPPGDGGL